MEENRKIWQELYDEFQSCIGHLPFELFVLSEYEGGGTFLIVSPLFSTFEQDERERWLEDILLAIDGNLLGNVLTPTELIKLSDTFPFETQLDIFACQIEAI